MSVAIGGGTNQQTAWAVAGDDAGNVFVAGDFASSLDLGEEVTALGPGRDIFVAKLGPDGAPVWVRTFGSPEVVHQSVKAIALDDAGDVVIGGEIQDSVDFGPGPIDAAGLTDVFVAKLDADGNTVWAEAFGDEEYQHLGSLAVDSAGRIALAGDYQGTIAFGDDVSMGDAGGPHAFFAQLDGDGTPIWAEFIATAGSQFGRAVAIGPDGGVHGCGEVHNDPLLGDGNEAFAIEFSVDGALQWAAFSDDEGVDACHAIAVDAEGNVALTGRFQGTVGFGESDPGLTGSTGATREPFLVMLDTDGQRRWGSTFGAGLDDITAEPADVVFGLDGSVILAGSTSVDVDFGGGVLEPGLQSIYVAVFDPDGEHLRSDLYGDASVHVATDVAIDGAGNHLLAGEFSGELDLGFGLHSVLGNPDGFVARWAP